MFAGCTFEVLQCAPYIPDRRAGIFCNAILIWLTLGRVTTELHRLSIIIINGKPTIALRFIPFDLKVSFLLISYVINIVS